MTVITIPENLTREKELVVITRKQYEQYLQIAPQRKVRGVKMLKVKAHDSILASVRRAVRDYKSGHTSGPFTTVDELVEHLKLRTK